MSEGVNRTKATLRIPPNDLQAEKQVLGSLLIDKNSIFKVVDFLAPEDFYNPANELVFRIILELFGKRQPVDITTLSHRLTELGKLNDVGGMSYLADLVSEVTTASNIEHFGRIVSEKSTLRELIQSSGEISEGALSPGMEYDFVLDSAQKKLLAILQKTIKRSFVPLEDDLKGAWERIEKLSETQGLRGVPTGFMGLDSKLSGLQKSDFVVLGARPSLGKTSLALDIARHAATKAGLKVGIFSLEMSREQVVDRLISSESNIPLWKLRTGRIKDEMDFQMLQNALATLSGAHIFIEDTPSPTIMQMRAMARRLQIEHGLDLLVVDYLQLIMPSRRNDNMVSQVTEISRELKALARELNVPLLALSQLSRSVDQRDDKTPKLHDLRESGGIEQDADVVLFISRDRNVQPGQENLAQIIIAKHRNGPLGVIDVVFDAEHASFRNIDTHHQSAGFSDPESAFAAL